MGGQRCHHVTHAGDDPCGHLGDGNDVITHGRWQRSQRRRRCWRSAGSSNVCEDVEMEVFHAHCGVPSGVIKHKSQQREKNVSGFICYCRRLGHVCDKMPPRTHAGIVDEGHVDRSLCHHGRVQRSHQRLQQHPHRARAQRFHFGGRRGCGGARLRGCLVLRVRLRQNVDEHTPCGQRMLQHGRSHLERRIQQRQEPISQRASVGACQLGPRTQQRDEVSPSLDQKNLLIVGVGRARVGLERGQRSIVVVLEIAHQAVASGRAAIRHREWGNARVHDVEGLAPHTNRIARQPCNGARTPLHRHRRLPHGVGNLVQQP
eukprot:m.1428670 g.1428670  ORF g.1428670 m.1428670 type:complete len:317 (+) comp25067_c0_seq3:5874-6824(+)